MSEAKFDAALLKAAGMSEEEIAVLMRPSVSIVRLDVEAKQHRKALERTGAQKACLSFSIYQRAVGATETNDKGRELSLPGIGRALMPSWYKAAAGAVPMLATVSERDATIHEGTLSEFGLTVGDKVAVIRCFRYSTGENPEGMLSGDILIPDRTEDLVERFERSANAVPLLTGLSANLFTPAEMYRKYKVGGGNMTGIEAPEGYQDEPVSTSEEQANAGDAGADNGA